MLLDMKHPNPHILQPVHNRVKLERQIQCPSKSSKPISRLVELLLRLPYPRDPNMARRIGPQRQTLEQTRPLEPLLDVEIYDVNPVLPFKALSSISFEVK